MWIATNRLTRKTYNLTDAQKAHYESSPHLAGKYTFRKAEDSAPKGVEKIEKPRKEKAEKPELTEE